MSRTFRYVQSHSLVETAFIILGCPDGLLDRQTMTAALQKAAMVHGVSLTEERLEKILPRLKIQAMDNSIETRISRTHGQPSLDLWKEA